MSQSTTSDKSGQRNDSKRHLRIVSAGFIGVRELSRRYGVSKSTLYEMIRTEPTFPCRNVGLRKKFLIDTAKFEQWLNERNEKQKEGHFKLANATRLLEEFKR